MTVKKFLENLSDDKIDGIKEIVIIYDENNKLIICNYLDILLYSVVKEMENCELTDLHINGTDDTTIYTIKCKMVNA